MCSTDIALGVLTGGAYPAAKAALGAMTPEMPTPPAPLAPPPTPNDPKQPQGLAARNQNRRRISATESGSSTLLTGPSGLAGSPVLGRNQLLGQ